MDTCAKCGAGLGVGRFCLNCGHRIGAPVSQPVSQPVAPPVSHPVSPPVSQQVSQQVSQPTSPPDATVRTARVPRDRHEAAAEAARRLQDQDLQSRDRTRPPPPAVAVPEDTLETDDEWFLPGRQDDEEADRLNWAAWVLAAAALVVGVVLALTFIGDDDSTATDDPAGTAATTPAEEAETPSGEEKTDAAEEPTTPPGPATDVARRATVTVPATAPPTTDLDGALVPYDAARMVDGDPATAWRMPGDGTGAQITLTLAQPTVIERVGLINGYAKQVSGVNWYPNNRRILGVRWTFEDGTSVDQALVEQPRVQRLKVEPVLTSTVTLTLTAVTPPGAGELGRDYTPISSVVLLGRPAG